MNRTKGLPSRWPRVAPVAACLFLALQAGATASHAQVNFEQHVLSDDEDGANSVQAADMDGDGDTDVVLASAFQDDEITWYENDGNHPASFEERLVASSVGHPQDIFATELDGDGDRQLSEAYMAVR